MSTRSKTDPPEPQPKPSSKRGRPKAGEREERQNRVLDAALHELLEHGYDKVTMLAIASRASASKESLYSWFGNKEGLFRALIVRNADASAARVKDALAGGGDPHETLVGYAIGLLTLLTSEASVALNRGSMSSPALAAILLESGRFRVGPIVEAYLGDLHEQGVIVAPDPAESFQLLYGLVMRDIQIRVLLGEDPPTERQIATAARSAIDRFFALCGAN